MNIQISMISKDSERKLNINQILLRTAIVLWAET